MPSSGEIIGIGATITGVLGGPKLFGMLKPVSTVEEGYVGVRRYKGRMNRDRDSRIARMAVWACGGHEGRLATAVLRRADGKRAGDPYGIVTRGLRYHGVMGDILPVYAGNIPLTTPAFDIQCIDDTHIPKDRTPRIRQYSVVGNFALGVIRGDEDPAAAIRALIAAKDEHKRDEALQNACTNTLRDTIDGKLFSHIADVETIGVMLKDIIDPKIHKYGIEVREFVGYERLSTSAAQLEMEGNETRTNTTVSVIQEAIERALSVPDGDMPGRVVDLRRGSGAWE